MYPKLYGSPDILVHEGLLVFLDGCFWHGCPRCFRPPKSRKEYWGPKISGNKNRDRRITRTLRADGWAVLRVWEHAIRKNPRGVMEKITKFD